MRSKTLLVSNIFSTLWAGGLLIYFINFLADGGFEALRSATLVGELFSDLSDGFNSIIIIDIIIGLMMAHMILFVIGALLGWLGFSLKKKAPAKAAAILYLVATILFPVYVFMTLITIILGFIGQSKQGKLSA